MLHLSIGVVIRISVAGRIVFEDALLDIGAVIRIKISIAGRMHQSLCRY